METRGAGFGHFDVPAIGYMREFALLAEAGMTPMQAILLLIYPPWRRWVSLCLARR